MPELGKWLFVVGVALAAVGALLYLAPSIPLLGKLPGDLRIERPGFRFYFPLATCIVLSVVLSLVLTLLSRLR